MTVRFEIEHNVNYYINFIILLKTINLFKKTKTKIVKFIF